MLDPVPWPGVEPSSRGRSVESQPLDYQGVPTPGTGLQASLAELLAPSISHRGPRESRGPHGELGPAQPGRALTPLWASGPSPVKRGAGHPEGVRGVCVCRPGPAGPQSCDKKPHGARGSGLPGLKWGDLSSFRKCCCGRHACSAPLCFLGDGGGPLPHSRPERRGRAWRIPALPAEPNKLWVGTQGSHAGLWGRLDSWGVRGVVCRVGYAPLFQGAHRGYPHGLAHLHPSPYSILIWGARGPQAQGPHESGRGQVCRHGLWGGSCWETADGEGTARFSPAQISPTESQLDAPFLPSPEVNSFGKCSWK